MKRVPPIHKSLIMSAMIVTWPSTSLACGGCVDHSLDLVAPFILPMFPVAFCYLLARRLLYKSKHLPEIVPPPKNSTLIAFILAIIALVYVSGGSLWLVMFFVLVAAMQNYIRSWLNVWRESRLPGKLHLQKSFLWIFLFLWTASIVGAVLYSNSRFRMLSLLRTQGPQYHHVLASYETKVHRFQGTIREELQRACDGKTKVLPFQLSGVMYLAGKLKDPTLAPCIGRVLVNHAVTNDLYFDRLFQEGLAALASLDKVTLINTCNTLLSDGPFLGKTAKTIDPQYGKRLSLIVSTMVENGKRADYERYITRDTVEIMAKYRTTRNRAEHRAHSDYERLVGLEGLDLDLLSFGIDPAILRK